jgi:hypothetical protein
MIGFRGDGTGIFPADCTPPTEFDGVKGECLAWKVPLPNHSNSSPIAVGRRVFVTCAAGWPEAQDTALLLCFDADSGKEVWRRELDEFATRPAAEAKEARALRAEYHRRIRTLNRLLCEYQSADDARKAAILEEAKPLGGGKQESFDRYSWGTGSAEQAAFNGRALGEGRSFGDQLRKVCGYAPITWSPLCLDMAMPTPVSDGRRVFVCTGRRTVHAFDLEGNVLWQVWQSDAPYNYHYPEDLAGSPVVVGDLLLMYCFDHLWAWELDTGRLRYRTESKVPGRHGMGQPVRLDLPTGQGATEPALFLWTGDLVRLRDGRLLCRDVAPVSCAELAGDGVDRVFLGIGGGGGGHKERKWQFYGMQHEAKEGGALGVQFTLAGDAAEAEKLWFNARNDGYKTLGNYPVFHGGRLWLDSGHVVDPRTGRATSTPKQRWNFSYNGTVLAGGHIYGIPESGINAGSGGAGGLGRQRGITLVCTVARLGAEGVEAARQCPIEFLPEEIMEPAKREQVVALTGRARWHMWYGWHEAFSAPFASGNRLFIRTFDHLYCFGTKGEPFRPSRAFEGEK